MAIRMRKEKPLTNSSSTVFVKGLNEIDTPNELMSYIEGKVNSNEDFLDAIARIFNIRIDYRPLTSDSSGSLSFDGKNSRWVITVNSLHHPKRQRFTLAHELAHFFLHRNKNHEFSDTVFFRDEKIKGNIEYEANNFAGALLMPRTEFLHYVRNESNSIEDVSNHFNVSAMAVKVRADVIRGGSYEY